VDVLLGIKPAYNLHDVLLKGRSVEEAVAEGPGGLKILTGASGVQELMQLPDETQKNFLQQIEQYCSRMDFVVVDTSAGIAPSVINFLLAADEVLLVTSPEPLALTDAYALLKVLSTREEARGKSISVIMNQIGSKEEALRSFDRLRRAAERFLNWEVRYLGSVAWDETVNIAVKQQVPFQTHFAASSCSRDMRKIAARLVSARQVGGADMGRFFSKIIEVPNEQRRSA
jgi:flagellar biosynthesis protein FlhG